MCSWGAAAACVKPRRVNRGETTMNCPHCNVPLTMSERQGVEIDYCPRCRGVWLDRGELDKILERQAAFEQQNSRPQPQQVAPHAPPPPPQYGHPQPPPYAAGGRYDDDDDDDRHKHGGYYPKRRKSWLAELFD
jgi:Zn-finger nucleic acid-binding protein